MTHIYQAVIDVEKNQTPVVLCTVVNTRGSTPRRSASKMLVYQDGRIIGSVGGGELERRVIEAAIISISTRKPKLLVYEMNDPLQGDVGVCGGHVEVFVEPILPAHSIIIVGGGHVGKAVAHLAKWLGYRVIVSDDRVEFCTPIENPDADLFLPFPLQEIPLQININSRTSIILTTRGAEVDIAGIPTLLETCAGYIGVIGSRKRWLETYKGLNRLGITDEQLKRIHSPIGMGIGAETPEEIAISIMAEVIMVCNNGSGKQMKESR
jgi:xanthine dehydrogenase accessory factor